MRISTRDIFDPAALLRNQAAVNRTQQQLSSGRKLTSPADDPVGAAESLRLRQSQSLAAQYQANQQSAMNTLTQAESILGSVTSLLQDVRATVVQAGNGALSDSDRKSLAQSIAGQLQELLGFANTADVSGGYLFGGYSDGGKPFSQGLAGVTYTGDEGGRALQVSESRSVDVSTNGAFLFDRIMAGNGTFVTASGATNSGAGTITVGKVADPTALTGHDYQIRFSVAGASTTYDVIDVTSSATVAAGVPYTSGNAINVDGMQVEVSGQPANGDAFDIKPATAQSAFATLQNLVDLLNTPAGSAAGRATLTQGLGRALTDVDNVLDRALAVRSSMGSRMQEIQSLQDVMTARDTAVQTQLAQIEDIDYAEAISTLSQQQVALEAAQKAYVSVTKMSLFSML